MKRVLDFDKPYYIAEIGGNHDGQLERAVSLTELAAKCGANAVKFQNFSGRTLFNFEAYSEVAMSLSPHRRSVRDIEKLIEKYSVPVDWFITLRKVCDDWGIDLITAPYDLDSLNETVPYIDVFKVGSGDLMWFEKIEALQTTDRPVIISTGASKFAEIESVVKRLDSSKKIAILQCTSNYEGGDHNMQFTNLNVLKTYKNHWPKFHFGISDHQKSLVPVIGAITLGCNVIERHFTDDNTRDGADHRVALTPDDWQGMVKAGNQTYEALGSADKIVEACEFGTRITQRRALWFKHDMEKDQIIQREDIEVLRPNNGKGFGAEQIENVIGRSLSSNVSARQLICKKVLNQL